MKFAFNFKSLTISKSYTASGEATVARVARRAGNKNEISNKYSIAGTQSFKSGFATVTRQLFYYHFIESFILGFPGGVFPPLEFLLNCIASSIVWHIDSNSEA
jgi:hypothetical protein